MSSYKNISGNWYITVEGGEGTIYVDGNLDVSGNITYVTELAVNDAFIIVAANNDGTVNQMGMLADKGANTYAGIRYNDITSQWEISSDAYANGVPTPSGPYAPIATGNATVAGSNTQIQFNDSSSFGASANLTFNKTLNQLSVLTGSQVLGNIGTAPTATANAVTLYNLAPSTGDTGIYARTSTTQDELISATRAKFYSLIL